MGRVLVVFLTLLSLLSGCISDKEENVIHAFGESEHWEANITYKVFFDKQDKIDVTATVMYLGEVPPNEISFQFNYLEGFPVYTNGTIIHEKGTPNLFEIPVGEGHLNNGDTFSNLKRKINQGELIISWGAKEEKIQLDTR